MTTEEIVHRASASAANGGLDCLYHGGDPRVRCIHLGITIGRGIPPDLHNLLQKPQTGVLESSGGISGG